MMMMMHTIMIMLALMNSALLVSSLQKTGLVLNRINNRYDTSLYAGVDPVVVAKTANDVARNLALPGKSWLKCKPIGVGACAGQSVLKNNVFETLVDTNDEWISKRTGIRSRHVIEVGSSLRDIAIISSKDALENAGVKAIDIDLVIVATSSPDDLFGDAASVASAIGATKAAAFDLTAACSGFVYGMVTASQFLHSGAYKKVLVVGADALTRFIDWKDRSTCILFGDGAGAVVLESSDSVEDSGLLGFALHSDGDRYCNLQLRFQQDFKELGNIDKSIVDQGQYGKLGMNGPEVYKFAVNEVPDVISEALKNAGLKASDLDWLLLHQANIRIMEHASQVLGVPMSKVLRNIEEYGNTSAGSIPLALAEAVKAGKVKKGDIIAVAGFGAGI
jgi:3-oxoacyl-[acyl-carrier-protein] synthase-3